MQFLAKVSGLIFLILLSCSDPDIAKDPEPQENGPLGAIPPEVEPDVIVSERATKICQLVGETDRQLNETVINQTYSRYGLYATDLGVPFEYRDTTYILFGDSWGVVSGLVDAFAWTTDEIPEDGLQLEFITDNNGYFYPVTIPGISQAGFEVPVEGVEVNGRMYIYHTTGHDPPGTKMGRSVLARADDAGKKSFSFLYTLSDKYFINVSLVKADASDWDHLPEISGEVHFIFGSGKYRESLVYLAVQAAAQIEDREKIMYFAGLDGDGNPVWSRNEEYSLPLFKKDNPCVGELSVSYNPFMKRWILLYNCHDPRGIMIRTSKYPWGPWSAAQLLFQPWNDNGYCNFIHTSWEYNKCDSLSDPGREYEWGGEYGPYQFEYYAAGDQTSTTIYFTLSTWNPYTVVLMKAILSPDPF